MILSNTLLKDSNNILELMLYKNFEKQNILEQVKKNISSRYNNKKNKTFLLISDIHFNEKKYIYEYDKNINYDYFIYVGDLIRNGYYNEYIIKNIIDFFHNIKINKKIIILGNNDYLFDNKTKNIGDILNKKLNNIKRNNEEYHIISNPTVIDNIFCSSYSKLHEHSKNDFGCNNKYLPSLDLLEKCNIFVTHGKFDISEIIQVNKNIKNKIFIFGHDHINNIKTENSNISSLKEYTDGYYYIDKNNNYFINVSISKNYSLNDREVYFTYLKKKYNPFEIIIKIILIEVLQGC